MHGKNPMEQVVQQVRDIVDEHDMRELERVAIDKMVRCVRNKEKDSSPPPRPPRESIACPSPIVPPSGSSSLSPRYEPDDRQEEAQVAESEDEQEVSTMQGNDVPDTQQDDISLEIVKVVQKPTSSEPSTGKGKSLASESVQRRTQLKSIPNLD